MAAAPRTVAIGPTACSFRYCGSYGFVVSANAVLDDGVLDPTLTSHGNGCLAGELSPLCASLIPAVYVLHTAAPPARVGIVASQCEPAIPVADAMQSTWSLVALATKHNFVPEDGLVYYIVLYHRHDA